MSTETADLESPAIVPGHRSVCCSAPLETGLYPGKDLCTECGEPAKKKRGKKPGCKNPAGDKHPRRRRSLQEARMLELAAKDVPIATIARAVELDECTVKWHLDKHKGMLEAIGQVDKYRDTRARILTAAELVLVQSMVREDKIEKASVNNLAYAYRQVHDTRRLEEGLSTSNTATTVRFTRVPLEDRVTPSED